MIVARTRFFGAANVEKVTGAVRSDRMIYEESPCPNSGRTVSGSRQRQPEQEHGRGTVPQQVASRLGDTELPAGRITTHVLDRVLHLPTSSRVELLGAEVGEVAFACLELAAEALDARTQSQMPPILAVAAGQWARDEVPLEVLLRAMHEGMKIVLEVLAGTGAADLPMLTQRLLDVLGQVTDTIGQAYRDNGLCASRSLAESLLRDGKAPAFAGAGVGDPEVSTGLLLWASSRGPAARFGVAHSGGGSAAWSPANAMARC